MTKNKNLFKLIIAIVMMINPFFSTFAFEVDGIYYAITDENNKTVKVTGYNSNYSHSITIPSSIEYNNTAYSVTEIGDNAFRNCTGLTSVTIPNSVTSIGEGVLFYGCSGLASVKVESGNTRYDSRDNCNAIIETATNTLIVGCKNTTIPNSVTSIGNKAFYFCSGLTSVTIPNSVTSIGKDAFYNCAGLMDVNISDLSAWCNIDFSSMTANPLYYAKSLNHNGSKIKNLVIPNDISQIKALTFIYCSHLTSVTIPNSVTKIGNSAFSNCTGLTSATIPNSVTKIGSSAFSNCTGLTSVTIPNSVTEIDDNAFRNCTGLTSVTIPNSVTTIGNGAFSYCSVLTEVYYNAINCTSMGSTIYPVFQGCSNLKKINIGDEVKAIPSRAFDSCDGFTSVIIPNSVTSIGDYAFSNCDGLTSVTFGNSITLIGKHAFSGCSSLTSITIPISVSLIDESAFYASEKITKVYISDLSAWCKIKFANTYANPLRYGAKLFLNGDEITDLEIPNDVTEINEGAFYGCSITSLSIPSSVAKIGNYAFYNISSMKSLILKDGINAISFSDSSFGSLSIEELHLGRNITTPLNVNSNLKYVNIGNYVTDIDVCSNMFGGCTKLEILTIGNSVTKIGSGMFSYCTDLKEVTIGSSVSSIGERAFNYLIRKVNFNAENCIVMGSLETPAFYAIAELTIGKNVKTIPNNAFYGCSVHTLNFNAENCISLGENTNSIFSCNINVLNIGDQVKTIPNNAFYGCSSLSSVNIGNSVTEIGPKAFYKCLGLTSVNLGNSVSKIGESAFSGCSKLTSVTIPNFVSEIDKNTFNGCVKLAYIYIPNSVTKIGKSAFKNCSKLTSVIIPNSVKTIEDNAFQDCPNLSEVTIGNSVEQIGTNAFNCLEKNNQYIIKSLNPTPPTCTSSSFSNYSNGTLYVPSNSFAKYFIDDIWGKFKNITKIPLISSITLNKTSISLEINARETLTATIYPNDAIISSIEWSSSNPAVALVNQLGEITGLTDGEAIITVKATDGSGILASCKVIIGIGGIEDVEADNNAVEVARYDIHGRLLSEPTKGINIIKMSDGTTRKELVK